MRRRNKKPIVIANRNTRIRRTYNSHSFLSKGLVAESFTGLRGESLYINFSTSRRSGFALRDNLSNSCFRLFLSLFSNDLLEPLPAAGRMNVFEKICWMDSKASILGIVVILEKGFEGRLRHLFVILADDVNA